MLTDDRSVIAARLDKEAKAALEKAASGSLRSVSKLVELIVVEWLVKNGHLKRKN